MNERSLHGTSRLHAFYILSALCPLVGQWDIIAEEMSNDSQNERLSYSESSSVEGIIEMPTPPQHAHGNKDDWHPVGVHSVRIPTRSTSDATSIASAASLLDSVGAATQAEQRLDAAKQNDSIHHTSSPGEQLMAAGTVGEMFEVDLPPFPQRLETSTQATLISQTAPILVALPLQEEGHEVQPGQFNQSTTQINEPDYVAQPQQTFLHQIPGVVTVPVGSTSPETQISQVVDSNSQIDQIQIQQAGLTQQSLQTIGQQEQIVGMMGAIPIVKIQAGTLHLVKKKKGRFKFLQETPTATVQNVLPGTNTVSNHGTNPAISSPGSKQLPPQVPANIAIPSQNHSTTSEVSLPSSQMGLTVQPVAEANNAPKVKKKGRFVVTSVDDPVSLQKNIQGQNLPSNDDGNFLQSIPPQQSQHNLAPPLQQQLPAQTQQQVQLMAPHQLTPQPIAYYPTTNVQGPASTEVVAHLSFPTTFEAHFVQPVIQQYQVQRGGETQTYLTHAGIVDHQHIPPQYNRDNFNNNQQQQLPVPTEPNQAIDHHQQSQAQSYPLEVQQSNQVVDQQAREVATLQPEQQQLKESNPADQQQFHANIQKGDPSPSATQQVAPVLAAPIDSPGKQQTTTLNAPNSPPSKTQTSLEPVAPQSAQTKKPVQKRAVKAPPSISSSGVYGNLGLGKLSYFLDQMKSEVTDADRMLKHLQTDMKVLRDKNKELEAKNQELERKLKEEIMLREKAEARCVEFRKKLRALSGETSAQPQDQMNRGSLLRTNSTASEQTSTETTQQVTATNSVAKTPLDREVQQTRATPLVGGLSAQEGTTVGESNTAVNVPNASTSYTLVRSPSMSSEIKSQSMDVATSAQAVGNPGARKVVPQTTGSKPPPHLAEKPPIGATVGVVPGISLSNASPEPGLDQRNTIQGDATTRNLQDSRAVHSSSSYDGNIKDVDSAFQHKPEVLSTIDIPIPLNPAMANAATATRRPDPGSIPPTPSTLPTPPQTPNQRPLPVTWTTTIPSTPIPAHSRTASLSDFDPLHSTPTANIESGVWPVISFPPNISLGPIPTGTASSLLQPSNPLSYPSPGGQTRDQYNQGAFISNENSYVVPIAFGVASTEGGFTQQQIPNNFQMQQPVMLQQPIMLQQVQGNVPQWTTPLQPQQMPPSSQLFYQQQQAFVQQQQQTPPSTNPFDPYLT